MSNYQVEPAGQPQALTKEAIKARCATSRSRASRGGRSCAARSAAASASGCRGHRRHARLPVAEPGRRLRRQGHDRRPSTTVKARRTASAADQRGRSRPTSRTRAPTSCWSTRPARSSCPATDPTGDGDRAQRPGALPALPAPRLQAEPVPQELLVRVPLPRLALRPARDQGARRPVRPGAARAWTASRSTVDGGGALTVDTSQDHARAAARRARPARAHPAASRRPAASDRDRADRPRASAARAAGRPSSAAGAAGPTRSRRRSSGSARRPSAHTLG